MLRWRKRNEEKGRRIRAVLKYNFEVLVLYLTLTLLYLYFVLHFMYLTAIATLQTKGPITPAFKTVTFCSKIN